MEGFEEEGAKKKIIFPVDRGDDFMSRQRLSADLQRFFKESNTDWSRLKNGSLDINEIFRSEELDAIKSSLKEHELRREFQKLFNFEFIDEEPEIEVNLMEEFA